MEQSGNNMLLTPAISARVLWGKRHNTLNVWCEKTEHHLHRDQECKYGDKHFSGKLPNTANLEERFQFSEGPFSTRALSKKGPSADLRATSQ